MNPMPEAPLPTPNACPAPPPDHEARTVPDAQATVLFAGPEVNGATTPKAQWPEVTGYEIEGVLGRGGMGVVYKARHLALKRTVALKMIRTAGHSGEEERTRFKAEAEAVARLQHPNIVQVFEVGEADGGPFCALEFVAGGSLARKVSGKPLPPREAVRLAEALARAMHLAHSRNVIHRDLKPDNVLMMEDGTPKVTDFGLSKLDDGSQTQTGTVMGTPSYMAPEQADGRTRDVGPPTDVYALGVILYEMLTGRPPFRGATVGETLDLVRRAEPVPPRRLLPALPRDLETVCLKCLEKESGRRYATGAELADDLGRFLAGEPTRARPLGPVGRLGRWCRRNPALSAVTALLTLALLAVAVVSSGFWYTESRLSADLRTRTAEVEKQNVALTEQRLRIEADLKKEKRISAPAALDRGLACCAREEIGPGLLWLARALELAVAAGDADLERVARVNLAEWRRQAHFPSAELDDVRTVAFSPDGRLLATIAGRMLDAQGIQWDENVIVRDAATGQQVGEPLRHTAAPVALAFGPEGKTLLVGYSGGTAELWDLASRRRVGATIKHGDGLDWVEVSPTGHALLTGRRTGSRGIRLWDAVTRQPLGPALAVPGDLTATAFSADGATFLTASHLQGPGKAKESVVHLWHVADCRPKGDALRHPDVVQCAAFSPNGRLVITGAVEGRARLWQAATWEAVGGPLAHGKPVAHVCFDGSGLALTVDSEGEVQAWDAGTQQPLGPRRVKVLAERSGCVFGPQGRHFVSTINRRNSWALLGGAVLWQAAPGKPFGPALAPGGPVCGVAFSADGRRLLTASGGDRKTPFLIRAWDACDGAPLGDPLAREEGVGRAYLSPDGHTVLTTAGATARLWDLTTGLTCGGPVAHPREVKGAFFAPDGRTAVTFCPGKQREIEVRLLEAVSGQPLGAPREVGQLLLDPRSLLKPRPLVRTNTEPLAVGPGGRALLLQTGSWDGIRERRILLSVSAGEGPDVGPWPQVELASCAVFGLDGRLMLTGGESTAQLWDAATGKGIGKPLVHRLPIRAVALRRDCLLALTGGDDGTAQMWDAATGEPRLEPLSHTGPVTAVAFGPEGVLLTACRDGTVRLWDAATARQLGPALAHAGAVRCWAFAPDGRSLLIGGADGTVRRWHVPAPLEGRAEHIMLWAEVLTRQQLDDQVSRELEAEPWRERRHRLEELGGLR